MRPSLLSITVLFIAFIAFVTCKRVPDVSFEQNYEQRFFNIPGNTHPVVKAVAQKNYLENQLYGFVNSLVRKAGFAYWDKAMISISLNSGYLTGRNSGDSSIKFIFIPFVKQNQTTTNAVLQVKFSEADTIFNLV